MQKSKHIWFEKLTLIKYFWIFARLKNIQIFYITISPLAKILVKFFKNAKHIQLERGILDKDGKSLKYNIERDTFKYVLKLYNFLSLDNYIPNGVHLFKDEWARILKSDLDELIKKKLNNIIIINEKYNLSHLDNDCEVVYISEPFKFDNIFFKLLNEDNKKINSIVCLDIFSWPKRILKILKFLISVIYTWVYRFFRFDYYNPKKKSHIFEEYIFNIFDRYPDAGHLFWLESSKIDPNDLVLYFDRNEHKINSDIIKKISNKKMHSLNMRHPVINVDNPLKILINSFQDVQKFNSFTLQEIDIWLTQINYNFLISCFREVFKKYKCKIIHQHQEFFPKTLAMALAIRMEKGIFVWNHWSIDHFPVSYFHWGFADIIFSWGQYNDGYFNSHNFSYKYLFQTGQIAGDGNYNNKEKEKENFKQFSKKLNLIINILDSSCGPLSQNSLSSMIYFYKEMLTLVYNNKNWAAIIKSKGITFEKIIKDEQINNLVELLKNENRILILPPHVKVSTAAKMSDISVSYGINSAGVIAALSGSRSIYWDLNGSAEHPLYYLNKKDILIFKTSREVAKAIDKYVLGDQKIGNHDDCLYLFDSFCDDNGQKRVGQIMARLFLNLNNNLEFRESLNQIKKDYEDEWGKEFVYEFGKGSAHKGNELWKRVQDSLY